MPNSYEGMYSSGTMSYLLDGSSMVFYTVDGDYNGDELWNQPKITRQMFHWGEDKLVQSRLYPQSNDGDGFIYGPNRAIVQEIFSVIMGVPNLWSLKRGVGAACNVIRSEGTHYRDYEHFGDVTVSTIKGSENTEFFTVGHRPICVECGLEHTLGDRINCCHDTNMRVCAHCGQYIDDEDAHWVDGDYYCDECCSYCDYCNEWHIQESVHIENYGDVCITCAEENFIWCEDCDTWHRSRNTTYVESVERYVCNSCLENNYFRCADCNAYYPFEDAEYFDDDTVCNSCAENREHNEDEEAC